MSKKITPSGAFDGLLPCVQEYTVKVVRAIADEPATTAYPALVVSLGSGVSIIKVSPSILEGVR